MFSWQRRSTFRKGPLSKDMRKSDAGQQVVKRSMSQKITRWVAGMTGATHSLSVQKIIPLAALGTGVPLTSPALDLTLDARMKGVKSSLRRKVFKWDARRKGVLPGLCPRVTS
jgi:hypothetical protein